MIDVDFVRPSVPGRGMWGGLLVVALACVAAWSAALWQSLERYRVQQVTNSVQGGLRELQSRDVSETVDRPAYAETAASVWQQGQFSAAQALTAIESVAVPHVAVNAVDIDNGRGSVKVDVRADDLPSLNQYLEQLNAGLQRPQWRLAQVRSIGGTSADVRAVIASDWR